MDILAHGLWANAVFYPKYPNQKKQRYFAVLFGVLPDIVSFAPLIIYLSISRSGFWEVVGKNLWVVNYAEISYKFTHSLVIFFIAAVVVIAIRKGRIYWPMFGWVMHILIDIPSHKNFYETPFLYPISNYHFEHGTAWAHPLFMIINYSALAAVYLFWFLVLRKKNSVPNQPVSPKA